MELSWRCHWPLAGLSLIGYIVLAAIGLVSATAATVRGEYNSRPSLGGGVEVSKDALSRDFICIGGAACGEQYDDFRRMLCLSLHGG